MGLVSQALSMSGFQATKHSSRLIWFSDWSFCLVATRLRTSCRGGRFRPTRGLRYDKALNSDATLPQEQPHHRRNTYCAAGNTFVVALREISAAGADVNSVMTRFASSLVFEVEQINRHRTKFGNVEFDTRDSNKSFLPPLVSGGDVRVRVGVYRSTLHVDYCQTSDRATD